MIRRLLALVALLIAPALLGAAPVARDWNRVIVQSPGGAFVIGNPRAKVQLVEYLSYTCPHCAHYVAAAAPVLQRQLIRSGSTRVELRHATRDRFDLAAALLARCAGPQGFVPLSEAFFAAQDDWLARGERFERASGARLESYPDLARLRAYADGAGLSDIARAHGMAPNNIAACFATPADLKRVLTMTSAAWAKIDGTPSFEVNGKAVKGVDWSGLEPILRAAGAK